MQEPQRAKPENEGVRPLLPIAGDDLERMQMLAQLTDRSLFDLVGEIIEEWCSNSLDAQLEYAMKYSSKFLKMTKTV